MEQYWGIIIVMVLITYGSVWTKDHSFEVSRYIIVVSVLSALFLYETLWFWRWRKNQKTEQENKNLRYENSVMKEYYDTLENQVEVVRKFHHDINKHMDVLNEMLGKMETPEIKLYSEQLEEVYQEMKPVIYCSNPIVNAVLVNKAHQCEEKHIKFSKEEIAEIQEMQKVSMEALTLLENIEENSKENSKHIEDIEQRMDDMTEVYRKKEMQRMQDGISSDEACILYSEMLTDFERIGDHILNIGQEMGLGKVTA